MLVILPRKCQVRFLSWSSFYKIFHCVRSPLVFLEKKGLKGLLTECEDLSLQKQKRELKICLVWGKTVESVQILSSTLNRVRTQNKMAWDQSEQNRTQRVQRQTFPRHPNCWVQFDKMKILILNIVWILEWFYSPSWVVSCRGQWYFLDCTRLVTPSILFIHVLRALNGFTNSR